MCGLVGVYGAVHNKEGKMFQDMLIMDVVRGMDSTGVAAINRQGTEPIIAKVIDAPFWLFLEDEYKVMKSRNNLVLLGHNRAATRGLVTLENAHPFHHGTIIGAHNGTIRGVHHLREHLSFGTDSEAIFNMIDVDGIDHTWKNVDGAAVLTWIDLSDKSLNMIRNRERPLTVAMAEHGRAMYWASEPWMIVEAAKRNDVKLANEPTEFHINKVYKFVYRNNKVVMVEDRKVAPFVWVNSNKHANAMMPRAKGKILDDAGKKVVVGVDIPGSKTFWEGQRMYSLHPETNERHYLTFANGVPIPGSREILAIAVSTARANKAVAQAREKLENLAVAPSHKSLQQIKKDLEAAKITRENTMLEHDYPDSGTVTATGTGVVKPSGPFSAIDQIKNLIGKSGSSTTSNYGDIVDVNNDMLDVSFFDQTNTRDETTKQRAERKAQHKAKKHRGRLRAAKKRGMGGARFRGEQKKAVADADFYDQYGVECYFDSGHYLDPDTAVAIDSKNAACEACAQASDDVGIPIWALKGA